MTTAYMDNLKEWGKQEADRFKKAAIKELNPKNPFKNRLVSAWGLLLTAILLLGVLGFIALQLFSRE